MRLVTYAYQGQTRTGLLWSDYVVDLNRAYKALLRQQGNQDELAVADGRVPTDMVALLAAGEGALTAVGQIAAYFTPTAADPTWPQAGLAFPLDQVQLRSPVLRPGKVICLGLNYKAHADEAGFAHPQYPVLFHKTATSLIGHGQPILIPPGATQVDYEVELAVIIGKRGKYIPAAQALDYIAGYACANDVSERAWQFRTLQWTAGKMLDAFCPLGPALVTRDEVPDPNALSLKLTLNGREMQNSSTADQIFNVRETIAYISGIATLEPGDIILTGTPQGIGQARSPQVFLKEGDVVTVEIEKLGTLTNPVKNESRTA